MRAPHGASDRGVLALGRLRGGGESGVRFFARAAPRSVG